LYNRREADRRFYYIVLLSFVQSGEWLKLKILELQPELTKLGASVKEATELSNAHDQVLLRLQVKLDKSGFTQCRNCAGGIIRRFLIKIFPLLEQAEPGGRIAAAG